MNNCVQCNRLTKNKKFCSSSCSASFHNKNRSSEIIDKIKNTWVKKRKMLPVKDKPPRISQQRVCICCGRIDNTFGHFQSDKCMYCNESLTYRETCKFRFNLKDFPQEFNLSLLTEYGMFHPKYNQSGVSRDHLLSVSYGKSNQVDPKIMSHPANCQLILHSENKKKQHSSSITLEELLVRIAEWDAKYMVAVPRN